MGNFNADLTERERKTKHVSFIPLEISINFLPELFFPTFKGYQWRKLLFF